MLIQTVFGHLTGGLKSPPIKTEARWFRWAIGVGLVGFLGNVFMNKILVNELML